MKSRKGVTRRSFMGRVTGGVVMTGSPLVALIGKASAFQQPDTDHYDSNPGSLLCDSSDNHCGGSPPPQQQQPRSGVTDSDPSDPAGNGRGGGGYQQPQQPQGGYTGVTDSDSGGNADRGGYGRGGGYQQPQQPRSGFTDGDPSDPAGNGRGGGGQTGFTDSDPSDRGGYGRGSGQRPQTGVTDGDPTDPYGGGRGGRGQTGITDSDPSDRGGYGRGSTGDAQQPGGYTGVTDSDTGAYADRGGYGRGGGNGQQGDDMPQIIATVECDNGIPLPITISELPSQNCHIVFTQWKRNTDYPVVVSLPDAIDGFGNHANGIQVIGAGQDVVYRWDNPHRWGLFVFACNSQRGTGANCYGSNTVPGPWSVRLVITQQGARGTTVMLTGNAFARGGK